MLTSQHFNCLHCVDSFMKKLKSADQEITCFHEIEKFITLFRNSRYCTLL